VSQTRRLAAILAADVAGYSRLMGADEEGTLERLKALRRELVDPKIAEHHGRIVKTTGDGLLVEFASVVDAVRCAVEVQQGMPERNTGVAAGTRIELRIGINLGDVIVEGDDLYGDGVNIAARIEALADAGGVFVSNTVHDHVRDRLPFVFEDLGEQQVKNIARASSFTYKGQAIDVKQVGRELGVGYVLEGSVRKAGGRVRITAQLIDATNGAHLWADRFDGLLDDVFELQDKVAASVAGVIEPALQAAETARSAGRPTADLTAYDLYLRAHAMWVSSGTLLRDALHLLQQAIERDPNYGPALALAASCYVRLCSDGWSKDVEADGRNGVDLARRSLQVAGDEPGTLAEAALALAFFGEDIDATIALVNRALALNPSFARGWYLSGVLRTYAGEHDLGIEHVETSLRLSPRERMGQPMAAIGRAYFFKRQFDEAATKLLMAIQDDPGFPTGYRYLAACYAHMGRFDEARAIVARLRAITPLVMPSGAQLRNPEDRQLFLSGLRLAAGEET
jgi:class 3 adenylate cyclase/tetratricopeptide (TPR) repeat protein